MEQGYEQLLEAQNLVEKMSTKRKVAYRAKLLLMGSMKMIAEQQETIARLEQEVAWNQMTLNNSPYQQGSGYFSSTSPKSSP